MIKCNKCGTEYEGNFCPNGCNSPYTAPAQAQTQPPKSFMSKSQAKIASKIYDDAKRNLHAKDGFVHVIMFNSFSKWLNQNFECETKYTTQIDEIVTAMQQDGYEIVDIKFNVIQNQGLTGQSEGFNTLIMYK